MGCCNESYVGKEVHQIYVIIPVEMGMRVPDIEVNDIGSLCSAFNVNHGTYALRTQSYSNGLARRYLQWSKAVILMAVQSW